MHFSTVAIFSTLAVCALAAPLTTRDPITPTNCGKSSDLFHLSLLDVGPLPPTAGANVTLHLVGTLDQPIVAGATATVKASLGFLPLYSKSIDVCETLATSSSFACPIPAGPVDITETVAFPSGIPAGTYTLKLSASNPDGTEIGCFSSKMAI
ncbi:Phosphatidylglycerol/phosphatidylinositol transfer protein [Thoreauomyces humboldtii]|nr:Phosphatidylglycerol/phosphatidylinositol transfer protein [Thoreauomyces humboldtii]